MSASIWQPGEGTLYVNAQSTSPSQVFTATAGQTLFTLTNFTYTTGTSSLTVYRNGQKLLLTTDFTETSNTSFTLTITDLEAGEKIEAVAILGFLVDDVTAIPQNLAISGGSVDGSPVGQTTPDAGSFTSLTTSGLITAGAGQIKFPATQAPSSDPNTLDDYEEGSYTATLTCGTSGTITLATGNEKLAYTKIGRVYHVQGLVSVSAVSSPVGQLRLSLPAPIADLEASTERIVSAVRYQGLTALASPGLMLNGNAGDAYVWITNPTTTSSLGIDTVAGNIQASAQIGVNFSYIGA